MNKINIMKEKLFEISNRQYVKIEKQDSPDGRVNVPVGGDKPEDKEGIVYFVNVDGMYSLCYGVTGTLTEKNIEIDKSKIYHLAAWTEVTPLTLEDLYTDFEVIREKIGRGGYGKDGLGDYRFSRLYEMSDDWVKNSIRYVKEIATDEENLIQYYERELEYRKENGITISDEEEEGKVNFMDKE